MKVRPVVAYASGAIAIAAMSFALGSYVFPHEAIRDVAEKRSLPAEPTPAGAASAAESASLESFGIDTAGTQATPPVSTTDGGQDAEEPRASGPAAPEEAVLRADDLAQLAEPIPGHLIGRLAAVDRDAGTIDVRVEESSVLVPPSDAAERLSFPTGAKVTLVLPPATDRHAQLDSLQLGVTVRAEIRIEPASGGRAGRIVAVSFEVMGSQQ